MTRPNFGDPPDHPNVAAVLGRLRHHIHGLAHEPDRYDDGDVTALAGIGLDLVAAAQAVLVKRGLA